MSETDLIIDIDGIEFSYTSETEVLQGIDLSFDRGEFVTVIGQNGSGKSTLVKHLTGLLEPDKGSVTLYDGNGGSYDTRADSMKDLSAHIGYVFQNPDDQIFHTRIDEEIEYGLKNIGIPAEEREKRLESVLTATGLEGRRYDNPFSLSIGERQRLAIASVLAMEPDVICVDEPTTGQDHTEARKIMDILQDYNDRGHTVVAVTHDMGLAAEYTDRVVVVKDGRIIEDGPPEKVFLREDVLQGTNIRPPQITQAGIRLNALAQEGLLEDMWLTVDDAYADIDSFHGDEVIPAGVTDQSHSLVDD